MVIETINQPMIDMLGKGQSGVGQSLLDFLPELAGRVFIKRLQEVYKTGAPYYGNEEKAVLIRNGVAEDVYFNFVYQPYYEADGAITGVTVIAINVTEHVLAKQKLAERDQQLRFAIDAAELATWDLNPETNQFSGNDRLKEWFGFATNEGIDFSLALGVVAAEERQAVADAVRLALQPSLGGNYDIVYSIIHPQTKKERIIRARGKATFNEEGIARRFNGTLQDVTEEVTARRALMENEERLRVLSAQLESKVKERTVELASLNKQLLIQNETFKHAEESSGQGSYSFNLSTGTLTYSDNLYRLLGFEPGAFSPALEEFYRHVHPEDKDYVIQSAQNVLLTKVADNWRYRMIKKNGEIIHIRGTGRIITSNEETLLVGTLQNVTSDVLLKQSLQTKNMELERSNEDLQQFAHVASHDLKEPLRKIKTFGSRLRMEIVDLLPEKAKTYLDKMDASSDRMFAMIDGVLLYSSMDARDVQEEAVNLNEVIQNIASDLELVIQQKKAVIEYTELPVVKGSAVLLHQLFYNLINNSLKFTSSEKMPLIQIHSKTVSASDLSLHPNLPSNQKYLHLTVKDNGIGFRQSEAEKIFKTFTRLNSKDKYEGTGLGLALCKKIVERHNGTIYAESEEGHGARFTVILPVQS